MSRLNDLIEQAKLSNPNLGQKLEEEFSRLENRRNFGLVFERHEPEATELYGRPVRRGDKVHILPERGSLKKTDPRLWRVGQILRGATPMAELVEVLPGDEPWNAERIGREPNTMTAAIEDVVVVAEHTDTIYPGLVETGRVDNAEEDVPAHTVINAENYHALQALTYTHRHAVDCIYIDPPYNTGAKDWKYNNDYVESDDDYRHSKWLSFMEKRLLLAKDLLNPDDSVLIITIDEKEYLRLGMLLEQVFPAAKIQMISSVISPQGAARGGFARTDEYVYFVSFGSARPQSVHLSEDWLGATRSSVKSKLHWSGLRRTGTNAQRTDRPNLFYPIFVNKDASRIIEIGDSIGVDEDRQSVRAPSGMIAIWPIRSDGTEGNWQISQKALESALSEGFVRLGKPRGADTTVSYLKAGEQKKVRQGLFPVVGHRPDGSIEVDETEYQPKFIPGTAWQIPSHDSSRNGSNLLRSVLPGRRFPFPKSLYAVEDAIRFFVKDKPNATIIDFFSGSGTTAHAVMRLNRQDGGQRKSISVTNNEVSADEQKKLRRAGLRPGDPEWEALGICDYVTKPRVTAAITGRTPEGEPIQGTYKFTDEFPMSDGFEANARFFTLTYEHPVSVEYGRAFSRIAPMLWMRAGQRGRIIDRLPDCGWDVTDHYGVLGDVDQAGEFVDAVNARENITHVFIVTDNISAYQRIARGLPEDIDAIRLYESYLTNFTINHGQVTL